jgi:ATP-binding cassette subfamily B protein
VNRVDVSVRAGELTVITGAVAAGKTTLLRGVLGLMPARSGHIRWNGRDIDDPGTELVPPRCAYVSQVPRLFSASLAENVRLGCDVTAADLLTSLAVAQFDVMALPHGLDTMVGAHGSQLSGGQAQRATVARAVVRQPDLLVLDDVSSALDFRTETALWEALDEAASTCLVVSHRTAALERAGHIVVLDRGNVAGAGSFDDLLGGCAEFRRLLDAGRDERSEGVA